MGSNSTSDMLEWQFEFDQLVKRTTPVKKNRLFLSKKKPELKEPKAFLSVVKVPRKWWQPKEVTLRCTCGWVSDKRYPERPSVETVYTFKILMRVSAELHWGRECPIFK